MAQTLQTGDLSRAWYRKTCQSCGAIVEFEEKDIWIWKWQGDFFPHKSPYASCPECGRHIFIGDIPEDMWARVLASGKVLKDD
jgi:hypothetical protein